MRQNESASDQSADRPPRRPGPTSLQRSQQRTSGAGASSSQYKQRFAFAEPTSTMSDNLLKELGSALPSPWTVHFHATKKRLFYKNSETGEAQWVDPTETGGGAPNGTDDE